MLCYSSNPYKVKVLFRKVILEQTKKLVKFENLNKNLIKSQAYGTEKLP